MPMDGHLSGPLIARGLVAALPAMIACATIAEHGLALGKDFAVSLPLCCPYGGIGPSSWDRVLHAVSSMDVTARTSILTNGGR